MKYFFLIAILFLFFSCSNKKDETKNENKDTKDSIVIYEKKTSILENIEGITEEEFVYKSNVRNIFLYKKNGTKISVPPNAFVDNEGNKVSGDVKITYKEIKRVADIIALNIDMRYDSAGISYDFQTAGMFDINAFENNQKVFLDEGKEISVDYDLKTNEDYNFYRYNEENWVYKPNSTTEIEALATEYKPKNRTLKPTKLNVEEDLIIEVAVSYKHIDDIKKYTDIIWKYAGDKTNDEVMKLMQRGINKPKLSKTSKEKGLYKLSFLVRKKEHNLLVSPVFSGRAFDKAMNNFNTSNNLTVSAKKQNDSPTKRRSNVSRLGLHNYDRIYNMKDVILAKVNFKIKEKEELKNFNVFHVTGDDNVIVNLTNCSNMYFTKNMNNKFIAILPDNEIAVLSSNDFKKIQNDITVNKDVILELNTVQKINSVNELDEIITSL